jgi:hypothetical protein
MKANKALVAVKAAQASKAPKNPFDKQRFSRRQSIRFVLLAGLSVLLVAGMMSGCAAPLASDDSATDAQDAAPPAFDSKEAIPSDVASQAKDVSSPTPGTTVEMAGEGPAGTVSYLIQDDWTQSTSGTKTIVYSLPSGDVIVALDWPMSDKMLFQTNMELLVSWIGDTDNFDSYTEISKEETKVGSSVAADLTYRYKKDDREVYSRGIVLSSWAYAYYFFYKSLSSDIQERSDAFFKTIETNTTERLPVLTGGVRYNAQNTWVRSVLSNGSTQYEMAGGDFIRVLDWPMTKEMKTKTDTQLLTDWLSSYEKMDGYAEIGRTQTAFDTFTAADLTFKYNFEGKEFFARAITFSSETRAYYFLFVSQNSDITTFSDNFYKTIESVIVQRKG